MGSTLQQILRSLCSNTDWNYAVFWKLNHHSRMVLTLEDAYYDNQEKNNMATNLHEEHNEHNPLGIALAKMAYHVYSLGEGIIGEVAVSGQHQWVFPEYFSSSYSSYQDIWGSQISAGIKTVLVVAVGPCGVVQLGSLCKVDEDATLVNHIRHLFSTLKDSFIDNAANVLQCSMNRSTSLPSILTECLHDKAFPDCSGEVDKAVDMDGSNLLPTASPLSCHRMEKAVQVIDGNGAGLGVKRCFSVGLSDAYYEGEASGSRDPIYGSDHNIYPCSRNDLSNNADSSAFAIEAGRFFAGHLDSDIHCSLEMGTAPSHRDGYQGKICLKNSDHMLESQSNSIQYDGLSASVSCFAGSELLEALGPAFSRRNSKHEESLNSEPGSTVKLIDDVSHSQLTFDSGTENLLDAVVANACQSDGNFIRHEMSSSRSFQSLVTDVEMAESSGHKKHDICQLPLTEGNTRQNPPDICGAFSSIRFSSTCPSSSSEQFQTSLEMPKKSKKRAKPGESSRPRPRDRQLIQDRIKELRELVPSGSKCSIDSLLERTIKHMLFLQNVTKHADKISKCANSKMQQKESGGQGSTGNEQGSSWAVEVGGHLQVCSIVVENLNKQGLMLIEMLCEECSHCLEIANVIKSLELTILRGVTETQGEKTWICFVVEGQNNKTMHRMDILWSLVQIFQPKATGKR